MSEQNKIVETFYVQRFPEGHEKAGQIKAVFGGPQPFLGDNPEMITSDSDAYKAFEYERGKPLREAQERLDRKHRFLEATKTLPVQLRVELTKVQSLVSDLITNGDIEGAVYVVSNVTVPPDLDELKQAMIEDIRN